MKIHENRQENGQKLDQFIEKSSQNGKIHKLHRKAVNRNNSYFLRKKQCNILDRFFQRTHFFKHPSFAQLPVFASLPLIDSKISLPHYCVIFLKGRTNKYLYK